MARTFYYDYLNISSITASSEAANYPASNAETLRIQQSWRSTSTSSEDIEIDLGATNSVASVWVQGVNFDSATVEGTTDDPSISSPNWVSLGPLTVLKEDYGRWKGHLDGSWSYRAFRITPATTTDSYFEIGTVYLFQSSQSLFVGGPQVGDTITRRFPRVQNQLRNGRTLVTDVGPKYSELNLSWVSDAEVESFYRYDIMAIDIDYKGHAFPVEFIGTQASTSPRVGNLSDYDVNLKEIV
jgi:hypothetical protein